MIENLSLLPFGGIIRTQSGGSPPLSSLLTTGGHRKRGSSPSNRLFPSLLPPRFHVGSGPFLFFLPRNLRLEPQPRVFFFFFFRKPPPFFSFTFFGDKVGKTPLLFPFPSGPFAPGGPHPPLFSLFLSFLCWAVNPRRGDKGFFFFFFLFFPCQLGIVAPFSLSHFFPHVRKSQDAFSLPPFFFFWVSDPPPPFFFPFPVAKAKTFDPSFFLFLAGSHVGSSSFPPPFLGRR